MSKYILLVIAILCFSTMVHQFINFYTNPILYVIFLATISICIAGFVISMILEKTNKLLEEIKNISNKDLKDRLRNDKSEKKEPWVND